MRGDIRCLLLETSKLDGDGDELAGSSRRHIYILSYQTDNPLCRTNCVTPAPPLNLDPHLMLRLSLFAYTRPLFTPRSGLKVFPLRSFGSIGPGARPRILEILRNRPPNVVTKSLRQSSRGIVDSAVVSRPSQTEAWRRYAVTAVRSTWIALARAENPLRTAFVGDRRRHYRWRGGVFEQGYERQPHCG